MNNTRPSFYLISSAVDGNVNAIEKILALYDPYISKCCLRPFYDKYGNVCIVVDMELKGRRNKEISYCEVPEIVVEKLAVWDEYESDYTAFDVCGIEVRVLDDDLAEAIKYLSEKDREILLMYFFLGMSDTEIGDRLKINRSTSFRSRKNSLEEIKKKLKENMNDE